MEVMYMSKARLIMLILPVALVMSAVVSAPAVAHEWLKNGVAIKTAEPVLTVGGLIIIRSGPRVIHCEKHHDFELVLGDLDIGHILHFLECITLQAGCDVHSPGAGNGLILWIGYHSLLVTRLNASKVNVLADELQQNETTKEFGRLLFLALAGGSCSEYGTETRVKGQIAAVVNNATETLEFPNPELQGNTLEAFGAAAKIFGSDKFSLVNGGALTAD
jgi:hypothetical protein